MAKKNTAVAIIPEEAPAETLRAITLELRELCEFRDGLPETEVDAIKACDEQIAAFVGREIRKVTSIAALLRFFGSQRSAAAIEEEQAAKWRKKWDARYNRLASMVHANMVENNLDKLEGATSRFRRQLNPEALDPFDTTAIPDEYLKVRLTMPLSEFKLLIGAMSEDGRVRLQSFRVGDNEVDAVALKKALQSTVDCHDCAGFGQKASEDGKRVESCEGCEGTGQVPKTVPGARLSRGEHLRVE